MSYTMDFNDWLHGANFQDGYPAWYRLSDLGYLNAVQKYFGTTCPSSNIKPVSATSGISIGYNYGVGKKWGVAILFRLASFKHVSDIGLWSCSRGSSTYGGSDGEWGWTSVTEIGYWHQQRTGTSFLDGHVESMNSTQVLAKPSWFFQPWNDATYTTL